MSSVLHLGDCLEVMAGMPDGSVDAVVTDPPYGLEFMGKEWDKLAVPKAGNLGGFADGNKPSFERVKRHLPAMQQWHKQWAAETLRVLSPSHYLLAFGGTRTWHRLACALEDAGFEIRDTLMWLYGSGFPKGKACLKPAWEPIILARKPGPMRELGIEECRIPTADNLNGGAYAQTISDWHDGSGNWRYRNGGAGECVQASGRWPANLVLYEGAAGIVDDASGGSRFFYCAKASRVERNAGLDGCEEKPLHWSSGSQSPGTFQSEGTHRAAQNYHPTVKPVDLMCWLVRLVARPGDVVLDPFTGSGTTGIACAKEGRDFIGIERDADYYEIARRRIEAAESQLQLAVTT